VPSECLVRGAQVVGKKVPIENDDDGPPAGCSTDDPGASKENGAQQRPLASSKQPFKPPASGAYKPPGLAKAGGGGAGGGSKLPMPRAGLSKATPTPSARPGAGASTRPTGTKAAPKKDKRRVLESDEESEDDAEESEESEESDGEAESDGDAESDGAEEEGVDEDVAEVAAGGGSDEADTGHDSASMKRKADGSAAPPAAPMTAPNAFAASDAQLVSSGGASTSASSAHDSSAAGSSLAVDGGRKRLSLSTKRQKQT